jgi:sugar lactone lactonase YvrE
MTLLVDDFLLPNGLAFSPDERILYVNDSRRRHIRASMLRPMARWHGRPTACSPISAARSRAGPTA